MKFTSSSVWLPLLAVAGTGIEKVLSFERPLAAFATPRASPSSASSCLPRIAPALLSHPRDNIGRCDTALSMGLGSFISKKVLGRRKDDDEPFPPEGTPSSQGEIEQAPMTNEVMDLSNMSLEDETTQDRVKRLKSGQMTEEEKTAFVQSTLSASNIETPSKGKKRIRQVLPSQDNIRTNRIQETASSFPKDSLTKNAFSRSKVEMDSEKKKREYIEMVTNPNRFKTYVSSGATEEPPSPVDSFISDEEEELEMEVNPDLPPPAGSPDLASRLEAAASAEETRKQDMLRHQEENRQKHMQKMAELQRIRNDEIAKRESEALSRKKEAEKARRREEEERIQAEEQRRQQMMEAQDAYWQKKLEEEREAKRNLLSAEKEKERKSREAEEARLAAREMEQERLRIEAEQENARVQEADPVSDLSLSAVLREQATQAAQRASAEEAKDKQLESLKALNSPLPTSNAPAPSPAVQQGNVVPPSGGRYRPDFSMISNKPPAQQPQPQQQRSQKPPESKKRAKTVSEVMAEIEHEGKEKDSGKNSGGVFGRLLGGKQNKSKNGDVSQEDPVPQRQPDTTRAAFQNTVHKNKVIRQQIAVDKTLARKQAVRQQVPSANIRQRVPGINSPARTNPVRQQVPGIEKDDFNKFSRDSPNKGMSVRDAMNEQGGMKAGNKDQKDRSRRWGVDISKFED